MPFLHQKDSEDLRYITEFLAQEHLNHLTEEIKMFKSQFLDNSKSLDKSSGEEREASKNKGFTLLF